MTITTTKCLPVGIGQVTGSYFDDFSLHLFVFRRSLSCAVQDRWGGRGFQPQARAAHRLRYVLGAEIEMWGSVLDHVAGKLLHHFTNIQGYD